MRKKTQYFTRHHPLYDQQEGRRNREWDQDRWYHSERDHSPTHYSVRSFSPPPFSPPCEPYSLYPIPTLSPAFHPDFIPPSAQLHEFRGMLFTPHENQYSRYAALDDRRNDRDYLIYNRDRNSEYFVDEPPSERDSRNATFNRPRDYRSHNYSPERRPPSLKFETRPYKHDQSRNNADELRKSDEREKSHKRKTEDSRHENRKKFRSRSRDKNIRNFSNKSYSKSNNSSQPIQDTDDKPSNLKSSSPHLSREHSTTTTYVSKNSSASSTSAQEIDYSLKYKYVHYWKTLNELANELYSQYKSQKTKLGYRNKEIINKITYLLLNSKHSQCNNISLSRILKMLDQLGTWNDVVMHNLDQLTIDMVKSVLQKQMQIDFRNAAQILWIVSDQLCFTKEDLIRYGIYSLFKEFAHINLLHALKSYDNKSAANNSNTSNQSDFPRHSKKSRPAANKSNEFYLLDVVRFLIAYDGFNFFENKEYKDEDKLRKEDMYPPLLKLLDIKINECAQLQKYTSDVYNKGRVLTEFFYIRMIELLAKLNHKTADLLKIVAPYKTWSVRPPIAASLFINFAELGYKKSDLEQTKSLKTLIYLYFKFVFGPKDQQFYPEVHFKVLESLKQLQITLQDFQDIDLSTVRKKPQQLKNPLLAIFSNITESPIAKKFNLTELSKTVLCLENLGVKPDDYYTEDLISPLLGTISDHLSLNEKDQWDYNTTADILIAVNLTMKIGVTVQHFQQTLTDPKKSHDLHTKGDNVLNIHIEKFFIQLLEVIDDKLFEFTAAEMITINNALINFGINEQYASKNAVVAGLISRIKSKDQVLTPEEKMEEPPALESNSENSSAITEEKVEETTDTKMDELVTELEILSDEQLASHNAFQQVIPTLRANSPLESWVSDSTTSTSPPLILALPNETISTTENTLAAKYKLILEGNYNLLFEGNHRKFEEEIRKISKKLEQVIAGEMLRNFQLADKFSKAGKFVKKVKGQNKYFITLSNDFFTLVSQTVNRTELTKQLFDIFLKLPVDSKSEGLTAENQPYYEMAAIELIPLLGLEKFVAKRRSTVSSSATSSTTSALPLKKQNKKLPISKKSKTTNTISSHSNSNSRTIGIFIFTPLSTYRVKIDIKQNNHKDLKEKLDLHLKKIRGILSIDSELSALLSPANLSGKHHNIYTLPKKFQNKCNDTTLFTLFELMQKYRLAKNEGIIHKFISEIRAIFKMKPFLVEHAKDHSESPNAHDNLESQSIIQEQSASALPVIKQEARSQAPVSKISVGQHPNTLFSITAKKLTSDTTHSNRSTNSSLSSSSNSSLDQNLYSHSRSPLFFDDSVSDPQIDGTDEIQHFGDVSKSSSQASPTPDLLEELLDSDCQLYSLSENECTM